MKFWRLVSILLVLAMLPLFPGGSVHAAAVGTAFTYQGRLTTSGSAVDQTCGFQFSLFDALTNGSQQGSTLTKSSVSVSDGLFNVGLDFGSSIYTGNAVFLNITVRCPDSGTYTSLSPRQELTPTPYSVFATTAGGVQDNDNDTKIQAEETTDEDKIRFDTAGSERMIIDAAGLVGIGTSSPVSPLDVAGVTHLVTVGVSGNATFADTILLANTESTFSQSALTVTTSVTSAGNTVFDLDAGGNLSIDGELTSGALISGSVTSDTLTVDTDTLSIDAANDRVGIGNAAPTKGKLEIDQTDAANLQALFLDSLETTFSQSVFTVTTSVTSAGNTVFDLDSGGNLSLDGQLTLGSPITGNSSYIAASLVTSNQSVAATNDVAFNKVEASSGITLDTSTGVFTLEADKTYMLTASLKEIRAVDDSSIVYHWVDSSGDALSGTFGEAVNVTHTTQVSGQPQAVAVIRTSSSTQVSLRLTFATSGAAVVKDYSWARIVQIGTTDSSLSSDQRLKKNITPLSSISDDLARLQPMLFNWRSEEYPQRNLGTDTQLGLIAQDVEQVFPALVTEGEDGFKRVNYEHIPMLLLQGMKEQQAKIVDLQTRNEALSRLVCADHQDAEICRGVVTSSGSSLSPTTNQAAGPALWVFGSIGAVLAALGAVFLFTSRRRPGAAV